MELIRNFEQMLAAAQSKPKRGLAVAAPYDKNTLLAVKDALESGLVEARLYGEKSLILPLMAEVELAEDAVEIIDTADKDTAVKEAVLSVSRGVNHILMKGSISTGALLKQALNRESGLNIGRLASHLSVIEVPGLDRLIISTDGGLNIAPGVAEKADIIRNAVDVGHALGMEQVKVACLAAVETVNPKMPATMDAAELAKMSDEGAFEGAVVAGPFAIDIALSEKSAAKKNITSPVGGHADVFLAPCIEVANVFAKTLNYLAHSHNAAIVVGTAAPIILPSRASDPKSKYASLALGVLLS